MKQIGSLCTSCDGKCGENVHYVTPAGHYYMLPQGSTAPRGMVRIVIVRKMNANCY